MSVGAQDLKSTVVERLTSVASHLASKMSQRHKVVVCRDLGPDVMPLLLNRPELDVRTSAMRYMRLHC